EALTRFEAEYRERMVRALETDLSSLRTRSTTAPGSRPEPSEVVIPAEVSAPTTVPEIEEPAEPAPAVEAVEADDADASDATTNGRVIAERRAPEPIVAAAPADGVETSEVDVSKLFEPMPEAPRVPPRRDEAPAGEREQAATRQATATAGLQALDLGNPD